MTYPSSYSFTLTAKGDGLTYQWYWKPVSDSEFSPISDKTTSVCSGPSSPDLNGTQFYCMIRDGYGNSVQSETVTLTVKTTATIDTQPVNIERDNGQYYVFTISALGDGLTYSWYTQRPGDTGFTKTSSARYQNGTAARADNGMKVYCVIADEYGNSVRSNTVTLTVNTVPVKILFKLQSVTVAKEGDTANLFITAVGEGVSYAWYEKIPSASSFVKSSNTTDWYRKVMTADLKGTQVYCIVTDIDGKTAQSETVTLSIRTPLKITSQPTSRTVSEGALSASTSLTAEGDGLTYSWYAKLPSGTSFLKNGMMKSSTYTANLTAQNSGMQVYCVVSDTYGNSFRSNTVTLGISGSPRILVQPVSVNVEKTGDTASVSLTASGSGLTYQWYRKRQADTSFSKVTKATGSTYTQSNIMGDYNRMKLYCVVTDQNGKSVKSDTITVFIGTPVYFSVQPAPVKVQKSGDSANVWACAAGDEITYRWYRKRPNASGFSVVSGATTDMYNETNLYTTYSGTQVYCEATDKNGNTARSNTVTLSIAEPVKITSQPSSVKVSAAGTTVSTGVSASGDGLAYFWYEKTPLRTVFNMNTTNRSGTYSTCLTSDLVGTRIYCRITDMYGNTIQSDTVTLTLDFGKASLVLPAGISAIQVSAFEGDSSVIAVQIPKNCRSIGKWAFRNCRNLNRVRIPADCTIGEDAFSGCTEVFLFSSAGSPAQTYCQSHDNCFFVEE